MSWPCGLSQAIGSLAEHLPPALSLRGSGIHWSTPQADGGEGRVGGGKGGLLSWVGQDGAEPNAGHAAVPTALQGLKITMFTHFQSWGFCLPVRRASGLHYVLVLTTHLLLGW